MASKFHMLHMFCGWNPWVIPQIEIDNVYENVDDVVVDDDDADDDDADDDDNNADADADDDVVFIHDITSGDQTW